MARTAASGEDGEGGDFTDTGHAKKALDVVIGDQIGMEELLQGKDLPIEERELLIVTLELEPGGFGEILRDRAPVDGDELVAVELATEVVDADATGGVLLPRCADVHA